MDSNPEKQSSQGGEPIWASASDRELLKLRLCDLSVRIEGSELEERVQALNSELEAKGLNLRPRFYLGDEWFSPEGAVCIAIPFYLAHPRLRALEKSIMLEIEGGTAEWCARLLRHEAGHCFDHAYNVSKRPKWRQLFGSPDTEYAPENYRPRPYSRAFVRHLDNWYAQAHPDEDFAETFAVWLAPDSDWKRQYAKWPIALAKLNYVEALAKEFAGKPPKTRSVSFMSAASRMRTTLEAYYNRRKKENAQDYPDFYDADLRRIFNGQPGQASAARFMASHRKNIIESVSHWTKERKITTTGLVRKLASRCESLKLTLGRNETETSMELAAYLTALTSNYLFTGKFKRSV